MTLILVVAILGMAFCQAEAQETNECPINQHFSDCGSPCALTCANYKAPPEGCFLMCIIGCQCDEGFVLDEKNNVCVEPENCPVS
ncbi:venom peptide SjAPI-like [Argiope bruennichi]|uniref:Venom peptide SjAPI like protein n=1 Tax=Argiope bruennichi TaxID=94029 RepID=A0A8T0DXQ9_ARGBR|nr:venom peptide SjAPI-like [Argiope bruennichi]XP_055940352.1 venom peptide SjAPI-like [Argiope bruennichi]KAF8763262.1 Venom peptide SjAPI like protein [Argiope bruennichi]